MNLTEPHLPEDFHDFWQETLYQALASRLDYHRSLHNDYPLAGFVVESIRFRGIRGEPLEGWIAYPPGARRLPSFLWIPPYGRESLLPNEYGTRPGFCSMSFNFHGHSGFYQEKYVPERGYFAQGAEEPESWIFRTMFQNAVIAARVLQAQIEVDEDRIAAMGMSQGGGMAIWLGAWCQVIRAVCADMPFLGAIASALSRTAYRYPLKELVDFADSIPLGKDRVLYTLSYFDTVNQASQCRVPTLVSLGTKDPAVRPEAVQSIHAALQGEKELVTYEWGHDWHPEMVTRNLMWLERWLGKGAG